MLGHTRELPRTDHPDDGELAGSGLVHDGQSLPAGRAPIRSGTIEQVSVVETVLAAIPQPYRSVAIKHRELLKFGLVGGTTWIIDTAVFLVLKATVLAEKPITAKIIAVLVATTVSYVLNREWSFRTREI